MDSIFSLYHWWECLGFSSLGALPLDFNCGFVSTSSYESSKGFAPEAALQDLSLPQGGPGEEVVQFPGMQVLFVFSPHHPPQPLVSLFLWGLSVTVAWELGSWGPWKYCIYRSAGGYCHRKYGSTMVFSSFWELCPSEDHARKWYSCLNPGNPDSTKFARTPTSSSQELWSLFFNHPVVLDSLWPQGMQHTRSHCPSASPRVCPSSCWLHQWCCPPISYSDNLFFSALNLSQPGDFPGSFLFTSDDQILVLLESFPTLAAGIRRPLWLVLLCCLTPSGLTGPSGWDPSLMLSASDA